MHIVGKFKLSEQEIQDLDFISSMMTVNYMRLATDIYQEISKERLKNEKEKLWVHHCSLGAILCHGYRMGVQAERQRQRAKQINNE